MEHIASIKNILSRWSKRPGPEPVAEEDFRRRTGPNAPMTLLLRFTTEEGPRTIVATGIPLRVASEIAGEMTRAGHFAEYMDEYPRLTVAECIKRRKPERTRSKSRPVIKLSPAAGAPSLSATA